MAYEKNLQSELARVLRSQFIAGPERTARDLAGVLAAYAEGALSAEAVEVEVEALPGPTEEEKAALEATRENNARVAEEDLQREKVEQGVVDVVPSDDSDESADPDVSEADKAEEAEAEVQAPSRSRSRKS